MTKEFLISRIHEWTTVAPLLAAIFAPFSILFDIPALTEPWFISALPNALRDPGSAKGIPDRPASLALSAIGLFFNVCANALLLVRFSAGVRLWRAATRVSIVFWIAKVIFALGNLIAFAPVKPGTQRAEGLWCALVSLIICGLISILLLCHWVLEIKDSCKPNNVQQAIRIAGRQFMINVTFFVVDVGILALIASQVEEWTYLQGIYFVTVTYLTIGFGDFRATHTVTRVLLFFFAIVGIAQLGNIVSMLIEFFRSHSAEKRAASRAEYERKRQEEEEEKRSGTRPDLGKEVEFLRRLSEKQEARTRAIQLGTSLAGLLVFWLAGAAIFSHTEGWKYGTGLYFAYVSFLTIGYGDLYPVTPVGRVVFILYAIIAVPIMASFAVQAVQQVFAAFSRRQYYKNKVRQGLELDVERGGRGTGSRKIVTHADFVEKWHREWEEHISKQKEEGFTQGRAHEREDHDRVSVGHTKSDTVRAGVVQGVVQKREQGELEFDEDMRLTEQILELALSLEWRARKLLISHLDTGGTRRGAVRATQLLLKADRNVQLREVKQLLKEIEEERAERGDKNSDEYELTEGPRGTKILRNFVQDDPDVLELPVQTSEHDILHEVRRYREDFAGLLAAGSRLMKLKGKQRALFERRSLSVYP